MPKASPPPDLQALLARAMRYCARAEHCSSQLRRKLLEWGCPKDQAGSVLEKLNREGWVDDARFARLYIRSKSMQAWGRVKLRYMLNQLDIGQDLINQALKRELDEQLYTQQLHKALTAKRRELGDDPDWRDKLKRHLYGRGYTIEEIYAALEGVV